MLSVIKKRIKVKCENTLKIINLFTKFHYLVYLHTPPSPLFCSLETGRERKIENRRNIQTFYFTWNRFKIVFISNKFQLKVNWIRYTSETMLLEKNFIKLVVIKLNSDTNRTIYIVWKTLNHSWDCSLVALFFFFEHFSTVHSAKYRVTLFSMSASKSTLSIVICDLHFCKTFEISCKL